MQAEMIAASYERVSTMMQARHGFSLAAQHASMEDFAAAQGYVLPEHLRFRDGEDANASGADWDLPALNEMLAAARRREFSVLIVPDLDRFARSLVKGLVLEEQLRKYGVRVVYQRVPVEDTPEGRLLKHQLFSIAEYEREKFRLRSMTGKRQKALSGQVVGGPRAPYGYRFVRSEGRTGTLRTTGLEPDPLTSPIVVRIYQDALSRSSADIAEALNAEGVLSPSGSRWYHKTVWRVLVNPIYAGTWLFNRASDYSSRSAVDHGATVTVDIPPLVDRATWDRAQAAMLGRKQGRRRGRTPVEQDPYLLRGLLECGHCQTTLYCHPNGTTRYYKCGHSLPSRARDMGWECCHLPDVLASGIERELWERITETLLDPETLAAGLRAASDEYASSDCIRRDRLATVEAEIARQRKRLDALASRLGDLGTGELFDAVMRQAKEAEELLNRLTTERAELAAVKTEGLSPDAAAAIEAFAADAREGLEHATDPERRKLYELLQVRGRVYGAAPDDPYAVLFGRKHRYYIQWTAAIRLRDTAADVNITALLFSSGGASNALSVIVQESRRAA